MVRFLMKMTTALAKKTGDVFTKPKNNRAFWRRKISRNQTRDRLVNQTLRRAGWRVLRIWEHTLRWATMKRATKKPQNEARLLNRLRRVLD